MRIDISGIAADFPGFRVAIVVGVGLSIPPERPPALAAEIARREAAARERWAGTELADIPGIAAWRRAYRQFGIKRTSYRSAVERLLKNTLAGRELPAINGFVDAYNAVSLTHVQPAGADDLDRVTGDLAFRYARQGDSFLDMGARDEAGRPLPDPPREGEVVYADSEKVLCRRWNWRQDARSAVTPATRRASSPSRPTAMAIPPPRRRTSSRCWDPPAAGVTPSPWPAGMRPPSSCRSLPEPRSDQVHPGLALSAART